MLNTWDIYLSLVGFLFDCSTSMNKHSENNETFPQIIHEINYYFQNREKFGHFSWVYGSRDVISRKTKKTVFCLELLLFSN